MKLQLWLNGRNVYEKKIVIDPEEQDFINSLPLEGKYGRVEYMEKFFKYHAQDMKGQYINPISKANSYFITVALEPKENIIPYNINQLLCQKQ